MYKSNNKIGLLRPFLATIVVGLSFAIVTQAHAQWKWIDANGITHYTDTAPPASVPQDKILSWPAGVNKPGLIQSKQPDATDGNTGEKTGDPAEMDEATKKLEAQRKRIEAEKKKAEEEKKAQDDYQRQRACDSAQQAVNRYASGMRIRDIDAKGEYFYLSDAEIQKRNTEAKGKVAEYCNE